MMKVKRPKAHNRKPKPERGRKRRRNPAADSSTTEMLSTLVGDVMVRAALHGATFMEKSLLAVIIPGILGIIRNKGKFGPEEHWEAFKPHCPQICGVPCPPECPNSKEARFDGCHVCDCLKGKKGASR